MMTGGRQAWRMACRRLGGRERYGALGGALCALGSWQGRQAGGEAGAGVGTGWHGSRPRAQGVVERGTPNIEEGQPTMKRDSQQCRGKHGLAHLLRQHPQRHLRGLPHPLVHPPVCGVMKVGVVAQGAAQRGLRGGKEGGRKGGRWEGGGRAEGGQREAGAARKRRRVGGRGGGRGREAGEARRAGGRLKQEGRRGRDGGALLPAAPSAPPRTPPCNTDHATHTVP